MRNPSLSRQQPAGIEDNPAINQQHSKPRLRFGLGLAVLCILLLCVPMWSQEPSAPPGTITAKAAPPPPLNGPAPAPAEVTPAVTAPAARRMKPEDNVNLI